MKYYINLFPEKEKDIIDKIIYFAFHYLRYILVITQFVVICVFFYRFKVDQEIVDLKDGLEQKKEIILATSSLLKEIDILDKKTATIKDILVQQESFQAQFSYFTANFPQGLVITNMSFDASNVSVEGYARNPAIIQDFKQQLEVERRFEKITLDNIVKTDDGFSFSLLAENFTPLPL